MQKIKVLQTIGE